MLAIRHSFFYLDNASINTEMGYDQALFSFLLIPVTGSFGCLVFFRRSNFIIASKSLYFYIIVGLIPVLISLFFSKLDILFNYSILDVTRRPPFLILLPIALSVLISYYIQNKIVGLFPFFAYILIGSDNFILHYLSLFGLYRLIMTNNSLVKNLHFPINFLLFFCILFSVHYFKVARINIFIELILVIVYLELLNDASYFILNRIKFPNFIKFIFNNLRVLPFYLIQAIFFNLSMHFKSGNYYLITILVIVLSLIFTVCVSMIIKKILS